MRTVSATVLAVIGAVLAVVPLVPGTGSWLAWQLAALAALAVSHVLDPGCLPRWLAGRLERGDGS